LNKNYSQCGGGVYSEWCLPIEGDVGMSIMTQKVLLDSYVQPLILSNASMDGLKLMNVHVPNFDIYG